MPECAVCSTPASNKCARCKCVFYCTPAHQKEDWPAHKVQCPRLAQEALSAVFHPCDEELLLRITTCLAQNGYHKEVGVMVQLNKAFWNDEQIWDAYKDVPGAHGRTRMMFASVHGMLSRVKWLVARGARVNTGDFIDGFTALMGASVHGHMGVVCELLGRGVNVNAATIDVGCTALMFASQSGHLEIARLLCAKGANVNAATTDDGSTALMLAIQKGHLEITRVLYDRGANVNAGRTDDGFTVLMWACQEGHLEIARELCARGAAVNAARTDIGGTALHVASFFGQLEVARLLLQMGADKSFTAADGATAFSVATGPHEAALQALLKP